AVATLPFANARKQLATDLAGTRLMAGDHVGREGGKQTLLGRPVFRRVGGDRRRRNERRTHLAHDRAPRGEMLGVISDGAHGLVAAGEGGAPGAAPTP